MGLATFCHWPELTEEDRPLIHTAMGQEWNGVFLVNDIERVYRAGIAAGIERAEKACDMYAKGLIFDEKQVALGCGDTIRALLTSQSSPAPPA